MNLEDIPMSCPMYEKIVEAVGDIEAILDNRIIDTKEMAIQLKKIRNTADDMRKVNGHLRDAAKIQAKYEKLGEGTRGAGAIVSNTGASPFKGGGGISETGVPDYHQI